MLTSKPRWNGGTLVVWDIQTGVIIREAKTNHVGKILFYGGREIIALIQRSTDPRQKFSIYDTSNGTLLFQGGSVPQQGTGFGAHWIHEGTLQFATSFERNGKFMINIYQLQPTSIPPLHKISSFPVPPQEGRFSFSPVSFHASFVTETKIVILDVQNSKLLLHAGVCHIYGRTGEFSPNGCFFASKISLFKIHVWQNTPTGYVPWSDFTSRLPVSTFLWSPTSDSFLCHCENEIILLHPDNHSGPLSPDENKPKGLERDYLVVHPADHPRIAMAQPWNGIVTILDSFSGTIQWVINTGMEIDDIKMIDNTVYVVGMHKFVSWYFGAGGIVPGVHEALAIGADVGHLMLSHDCTQIAFAINFEGAALYDIKAQRVLKSFKWGTWQLPGFQFSPDGHQMWCTNWIRLIGKGIIVRLDRTEDWSSPEIISEYVENGLSWNNLFSPDGYHVGMGNVWIVNSKGSKILWLPPHWRRRVRWEGKYMALVDHHLPTPIIIEFQP